MNLTTHSEKETRDAAHKLAAVIIQAKPRKHALVFGLTGELGAGKTLFIKALAKSLGVSERVSSPSFLIFRTYKINLPQFQKLHHVDDYRLKDSKDIVSLGFNTMISDSNSIMVIEWAEKIKTLLTKNTHWIFFHHGDKPTERIIEGLPTTL